MSKMLKSAGAMGIATFLSRILGLVREMVYTSFMGAGAEAGAFRLALMLPNLFRRLLGEGALTAAFIPIFKDKEKNSTEPEMWRAANAVISGLVVVSSLLVGVVILGLTAAIWIGNSGFTSILRPNTEYMLSLSRVMFPYLIFICIAAVLMGMLNARGHFFVPAMGSVVLNVILIATVLLVAPHFGNSLREHIYVLAGAVVLAGIIQAAYQLPTLYREGFRLRWVSPWKDPTVKAVVRNMIPGMMGVAAFQLNVVITQAIAWQTDNSIVAAFDAAVRLMEFPQGIFGISLATYLLPTLSGLASEKKFPEFRNTLTQGVGYLFLINLLAGMLLLVLAEPMVRLLFERGKFTAMDTYRSSIALACLAPGLIAFSLNNVTARAFYALGDTKTPMKISSVCLVLNIIFGIILIPTFQQGGMGVANTLSGSFNVYLLIYALRRKLPKLTFRELLPQLGQMLTCATAAGVVAWGSAWGCQAYFGDAGLAARFLTVFLPIALATGVYFALLTWLKIPQAKDVLDAFLEKFRRQP